MPTELALLPIDSRPMLDSPEYSEPVEPVDTQRESSGQAPIAGLGDIEGEGESLRKDGCSCSSGAPGVLVMIAKCLNCGRIYGCLWVRSFLWPKLY